MLILFEVCKNWFSLQVTRLMKKTFKNIIGYALFALE